MTHRSEVVYNPSEKEWWNPIYDWWENNDISEPWSWSSTSCAVAHFQKNPDGTFTALPQCTDTYIKCEGREDVEIFEGDTLVWDGKEIIVERTGIGHNSRSYFNSLRVPTNA